MVRNVITHKNRTKWLPRKWLQIACLAIFTFLGRKKELIVRVFQFFQGEIRPILHFDWTIGSRGSVLHIGGITILSVLVPQCILVMGMIGQIGSGGGVFCSEHLLGGSFFEFSLKQRKNRDFCIAGTKNTQVDWSNVYFSGFSISTHHSGMKQDISSPYLSNFLKIKSLSQRK